MTDERPPGGRRPHLFLSLRSGVRAEVFEWAKKLRQNPARGEPILWERLRGKQLGFRFRRQVVLRGWIADFWCPAKRLIVEVDGLSHLTKRRKIKDWFRDKTLCAELGIKTLRFKVEEVESDLDRVVHDILTVVEHRPTKYLRYSGGMVNSRSCRWLPRVKKSGDMTNQNRLGPHTNDDIAQAALRAFEEIEEDLREVSSLDEYEELVGKLVEIKDTLKGHREYKRVAARIRAQQERKPQIQEIERSRQLARLEARIAELERNPPRCRQGHPMVLRRGPLEDLFWGCSHFPICRKTKQLTQEQRSLLSI